MFCLQDSDKQAVGVTLHDGGMTQYIAADTLKVMNDFIQQTDNLSAIPLFRLFQFFCFSFYSAPESVK
ncbi:hypothetical protein D6O16_23320 [Salmonella enterica]|nr:hypothetical protein [Salmonella enterica]